jgi:uracil-DNA glycosylase
MVHFLQNDWAEVLDEEFEKPYYKELREFLKHAYASERVYPPMEDIYNALRVTPYASTKVVILGQDPYHGPGQAHGLSFSVRPGVQPPPSLLNIFKEMESDIGCVRPNHGCLLGWAEQGVLLLNTTLTVAQGRPKSHAGHGWETLTDAIIAKLSARQTPMVFILWGAHAQSKVALIDTHRHHIIKSPHPSPLSASRGFFGSRPFSRANAYLIQDGLDPIDWCRL